MTRRLLALLLMLALAACSAPDTRRCAQGCPNDAQIATAIRNEIFRHAEFAGDDIQVQAHDGVVYLSGLADTNFERDAIESLARGVNGVVRVVDSIELRNHVY